MRRKNEAGKDKKRELFSYLVNISHLCSGISIWLMAAGFWQFFDRGKVYLFQLSCQ